VTISQALDRRELQPMGPIIGVRTLPALKTCHGPHFPGCSMYGSTPNFPLFPKSLFEPVLRAVYIGLPANYCSSLPLKAHDSILNRNCFRDGRNASNWSSKESPFDSCIWFPDTSMGHFTILSSPVLRMRLEYEWRSLSKDSEHEIVMVSPFPTALFLP
jgi:hypothetical protein